MSEQDRLREEAQRIAQQIRDEAFCMTPDGWLQDECERIILSALQQASTSGDRSRSDQTTDDMGANEASNTRNPSSPVQQAQARPEIETLLETGVKQLIAEWREHAIDVQTGSREGTFYAQQWERDREHKRIWQRAEQLESVLRKAKRAAPPRERGEQETDR